MDKTMQRVLGSKDSQEKDHTKDPEKHLLPVFGVSQAHKSNSHNIHP